MDHNEDEVVVVGQSILLVPPVWAVTLLVKEKRGKCLFWERHKKVQDSF